VVLFLHIKIMWIATVERSVKKQCGFIILSSSNCSIPSTKLFNRSILFRSFKQVFFCGFLGCFQNGKTCQSPSLIAEHFPCTVTDFTTCSLPPFSVCTFDVLPKSDDVVTFYWIYLHFPEHFLFTSPSSKPLFMYLTHVSSCFGAISSKNKFPAIFMLLSHLTFSCYNF
jgi:hypothetical protein